MGTKEAICFFLALAASGCSMEGGGPPMVPGEFQHGVIIGESDGGQDCLQCHSQPGQVLMSGTSGYHHYMNNDSATAATLSAQIGGAADAARNCLICHVDHNLFNPSLNPQSPGRSHNLRVSVSTAPSSSPSTFTNSDYSASTGGLCLSCHQSAHAKAYAPADGTANTLAVDKLRFDAATDAHNFTAGSTFIDDGSAFFANCLKCHDDGRPRIAQAGAVSFALHDSLNARALPLLGSSFAPADPPTAGSPNAMEEDFCFRCHGRSTTYASTAATDHFAAVAMSARALNVGAAFADPSLQYKHPVAVFGGRHRPSSGNAAPGAPDDLGQANRHAECTDCHDAHAARPGVHSQPGSAAGSALTGTWGVQPAYGTGAAPASFTVAQVAEEAHLCLKCHSSYVTGYGNFDKAAQFSPNQASFHPVLAAGRNTAMSPALLAPWDQSSRMTCTACHGSSDTGPARPRGPHASAYARILRKPYTAPGVAMTTGSLCVECHDAYTYARLGSAPPGYAAAWTNFRHQSTGANLHRSDDPHGRLGCGACHAPHGSDRPHLIAVYDATLNPDGRITSITDPGAGNYRKSTCSTRTTGCH